MRVLDNLYCIKYKSFDGSVGMQDEMNRLLLRLGIAEERLVTALFASFPVQSPLGSSMAEQIANGDGGSRTHSSDDGDVSWSSPSLRGTQEAQRNVHQSVPMDFETADDHFLASIIRSDSFGPSFLLEAEEIINREELKMYQRIGAEEVDQRLRRRVRSPQPAVLPYLLTTLFENENISIRDSLFSCLEFLRHRRLTVMQMLRNTEQHHPTGAVRFEMDQLSDELRLVENTLCLIELLLSRQNIHSYDNATTERDSWHDLHLVTESCRTIRNPNNGPVVSADLALRNSEFEERKTWADFERNSQEIGIQNCPVTPALLSNGPPGLSNLNTRAAVSKNGEPSSLNSSNPVNPPPLSTPSVDSLPTQRDIRRVVERPNLCTPRSGEDPLQPPSYNIPAASYVWRPSSQPHDVLRAQEEYNQYRAEAEHEAQVQAQQLYNTQLQPHRFNSPGFHHQVQMQQPWPTHVHYVPLTFRRNNVEARGRVHPGQEILGNGLRLRMPMPEPSTPTPRNNLNCQLRENPIAASQRLTPQSRHVYYEMVSDRNVTGPHVRSPREAQATNIPNQVQNSELGDNIRELNRSVQKLVEVASRTEDILVSQRTYLSWIESGLSTLRQDVRDIREQMTSVDYLENLRFARRMDEARVQQDRANSSRRNIVDELSRYTEEPETSRRSGDYLDGFDRLNITNRPFQGTPTNERGRTRVLHPRVVENFEIQNLRMNDRELGGFESSGGSATNGHSSMLNNQVPPGTRANNYWDNFKSYSRQNMLSSSKANIPTNGMSPCGSETRSVSNEESSYNPTASTSRRDSRGERASGSASKKSSLSANFVENIGLKKRNKDVKLQLSSPSRSTSSNGQSSQNEVINLQSNFGVLNSFVASSSLEAGAISLDDCQNAFDGEDKVSRPIRTSRMEYYQDQRSPEHGQESSENNVSTTLPDELPLLNGTGTSTSPSLPSSLETDLMPVDLSSHQTSESAVQRDNQDERNVLLRNGDVSNSQDVRNMTLHVNGTVTNDSATNPDPVCVNNVDDTYAGMMLDYLSLDVRDDAIVDFEDDEEENRNLLRDV